MLKKYIFKPLKNLIIIFGITFILLEIVLAIYIRTAEIKIELPTYTFQNTQNFWFDLNEDFGTIHLPNDVYRQKKYCFDVVYESNSKGFRDAEREVIAETKRVVALGDSFTEGIGVQVEDRLTNLLEQETAIPHLNYGLAGNFGPTQYFMLYKTLAREYTHEAVLVGILPSNDFIDDDYEIGLRFGSDRYRPFLKGNYPNFEMVYHTDSIHKSKALPRKQNFINKVLKNFTNSYNMYNYMRVMRRVKAIPQDKLLEASKVPSYFNYSEKQFNRMRYTIEEIKKLAGNRPVMIYSIPIEKEIKAYREHGKNPLGKELKAVCDSINVEYLDLLPKTENFTEEEYKALFLSCDGHWSEAGNAFAKKHIESYFSYYKK
ncbi:hypothetical protein IMCC3317_34990 [Kordia antarctica]|uniref:SGNH hydrolase-type esterase domain-containing protein n=1 Tax=Kordia antarctica TaxID=1218801 RepID=A0A7L4ZN09_9FLAO|nr:hypothetical protein [Kordia antarctica]QHI38113.1 hypothetical protein IMCC3317_34990 [Kordia antarctica]